MRKASRLVRGGRDALAQAREQVAQRLGGDEVGRGGHQRVVRGPAALGMEGRVAPVQGRHQVAVGIDGQVRGPFQLGEVGVPDRRVLHRHGLVGAVAGGHNRLAGLARPGVGDVVLQVVGGIVGGAHRAHVHPGEQGPGTEGRRGELGVAGLPDHRRGAFAERLMDAEIALQLQVGPMVERVADQGRHGLGPGQEGAVIGLVPGDVLLGHAVGAHHAPLVVVAAQPGVGDGLEGGVVGHVRGGQVAVVVDDRHGLGVLEVQPPRTLVRQQEVRVHERLHSVTPSLKMAISR